MEVLQTSALPLGDGAGRNWGSKAYLECPAASIDTTDSDERDDRRKKTLSETQRVITHRDRELLKRYNSPPSRFALRRGNLRLNQVRRLERETGFEPATSTLARSHSTTELFPLATKP